MTEAPQPFSTDHALLRWLERCHGIDVDHFRAVMQAEVEASVLHYAETKERAEGSHSFLIVEGRVITVLTAKQRRKKGKAQRADLLVPRLAVAGEPSA